jgi:hypothetical protein
MLKPSFLSTCIVVLLVAAPAAAMTVTVSPFPPPPAEVILGYDVPADAGSYLCSHGSATVVDLGQTFRLTRPTTLDKITLKVRPMTDRTAGELVTLVFGTYTDPSDDSMNELLAAETRVLPSTIPTGELRYVTFDVTDLPLAANRQYGFLLGFTGGGNVNDARLDVMHVGEDAYPGGQAVEKAGAVTSAYPYDLAFFLHGVEQVADDALLLYGGRFRVTAHWRTFAGAEGSGVPVPLTDAAGYFWFFDPSNVELVVKVHDACVDPFDHFWVFCSGLTNVDVVLTVTDTVSGKVWSHHNPMGEPFPPIFDTEAFATCMSTSAG